MEAEQRKVVRLNRSGGSRSVTLPKTWLRRIGLDDDAESAELVLSESGISIERVAADAQSIEDEPDFAGFLNFMLKSSFLHPDSLVNAADVFAEDEDLVPAKTPAKAGA